MRCTHPSRSAAALLFVVVSAAHGQTVPPATGAADAGLPPRDAARPPATGTSRIRGRVLTPRPAPSAASADHADGAGDWHPPRRHDRCPGRFRSLPIFRERPLYDFGERGALSPSEFGQRRPFRAQTPCHRVADGQTIEQVDFTLPRGGVAETRDPMNSANRSRACLCRSSATSCLPGGSDA